jgi:ribosomal protein S18 acetylase RimI-like enzyme
LSSVKQNEITMDAIQVAMLFAFVFFACGAMLIWSYLESTRARRMLTSKKPAPVRDLDPNMAVSFEIRPMEERDYVAVQSIEYNCFGESYVTGPLHLWLRSEEPEHVSYVAAFDGKVVGYTHLELTKPELFLAWIGVSAAARSHGVGTKLLKHVINVVAPSIGCTQVRLTVRDFNWEAARLYRAVGFEYVRDVGNMHEVIAACPANFAKVTNGVEHCNGKQSEKC